MPTNLTARSTSPSRKALSLTFGAALAVLAACSDSGGGAGDAGPVDTAMRNPVDDFVGIWDITGNWNGTPGDLAYLVIRPVGEDGEAEALIYDFDDNANCYFRPTSGGRVFPDPALMREAFLRNVGQFDDGRLALSGQSLSINYFDTFDIDDDGETGATTYPDAPPITGIVEQDIGEEC